MTSRLFRLPKPEPVLTHLTEKQHRAYTAAKTTAGGITADELGAIEHERRGKHPADLRCEWCAREGKGVLESVALKALVVRRRDSGRYEPRDGSGTPILPAAQVDELPGESWEDLFRSDAA